MPEPGKSFGKAETSFRISSRSPPQTVDCPRFDFRGGLAKKHASEEWMGVGEREALRLHDYGGMKNEYALRCLRSRCTFGM